MRRSDNLLITLLLCAATWGWAAPAEARGPKPAAAPKQAAPAEARGPKPAAAPKQAAPPLGTPGAPVEAPPPPTAQARTASAHTPRAEATPSSLAQGAAGGLTLEEAAALSEAEVIEVWAERPQKPFDRDTKLRLTGAELAARGATDLGSALALLPDLTVREGGRGGFNIDVRGARKGAVRILLDGVSVSDPYYGTFDVSTIPITDIEQIRVSTAPSSPIDGPGGPGGVVEVHTRDAIGPQLVRARLSSDTAPGLSAATTARAALAEHTALRLSMSGAVGARDFSLPEGAEVGESRRAATGAIRIEHRRGERRVALDASVDDRRYVSPPSDERVGSILLIDRETTLRAQLAADDRRGTVQLQARAWADGLRRRSRFFRDAALSDQASAEDLRALRVGGQVLATQPLGAWLRWAGSATVDRDSAEVRDATGRATTASTAIAEVAGDLQLEQPKLLVDLAIGLAAPFGIDADPWLEAKLDARYRLRPGVELAVIAARKGRTPSLRERFDPQMGNERLGPELAHHLEVRTSLERELVAAGHRLALRAEVAPFVRRTTGTVRVDPKLGMQVNLGELDVRGADISARLGLERLVEAGGGYSYIFATSDSAGDDPLDRLPRHRFDTWLSVRPLAPVSVVGHLRYFGRRLDQGQTLGAYGTVELSATAQLGDEYLVVLRIDDVLDERPETRAGYHALGRLLALTLQGSWQ